MALSEASTHHANTAFRMHATGGVQRRFHAVHRFLAACALLLSLTPAPATADVARGRYLAILGDCAGCHTRPHGAVFAGGLGFNAQFGTVYSTNITPDKDTGIGNWTAGQFYRALHEGVAADGRHLYPA